MGAQEVTGPTARGVGGGSKGSVASASPGQSAVSLKARFLQQPRHRLNTHLLPWTQKSYEPSVGCTPCRQRVSRDHLPTPLGLSPAGQHCRKGSSPWGSHTGRTWRILLGKEHKGVLVSQVSSPHGPTQSLRAPVCCGRRATRGANMQAWCPEPPRAQTLRPWLGLPVPQEGGPKPTASPGASGQQLPQLTLQRGVEGLVGVPQLLLLLVLGQDVRAALLLLQGPLTAGACVLLAPLLGPGREGQGQS